MSTVEWFSLSECPSTNDVAAERGEALSPGHYLVVTTERQTAGRGQRGRAWQMAPQAGIAFSVATRLPPTAALAGLSLAVGAALAERLEFLDLPVHLKWPNDLLVRGRKVGGVLVEAQWRSGQGPLVVVGVGINRTAAPPLPPDPWQLPATALAEHLPIAPPAETLLRTLALAVVAVLEDYRQGVGFVPWQAAWWARAAWRDRWLLFLPTAEHAPNATTPAAAVAQVVRLASVGPDGALQLTPLAGGPIAVTNASVRLRPVPLLLDLGNSRGKWWLSDTAHGIFSYDEMGLTAWQRQLATLELPSAALGVCVASDTVRDAVAARLALLGVPPQWVHATPAAAGVRNGYTPPERLGPDRWVAAIGAWHLGLAPAVVVGCGTATTIDWLDATGTFRGGAILPGVGTMLTALGQQTARLPTLTPEAASVPPGEFPPTTTEAAIGWGVALAQCGAIVRFLDEVCRCTSPPPRVLLHGGAASLISARLDIPHEVRDNLFFVGLAALACQRPFPSDPIPEPT